MNIKEAKIEIANTVRLYLEKDNLGEYLIPTVRQRPVFLVGAPGIGKTAIMEQIACELDIALVSYSMTHHTRQSAIGLPYLSEKKYGGRTCTISEYTMSEIIASIYEIMEKSGKKEGILFLDEINCVSETLAPSMLLFLQYKRFGNEQVPPGWVIVTAGNPPQYNKSVKEFDVATLDRLKYMRVEENYAVWKEYASTAGLHPAVLAFLDLNENSFYQITSTVDGKQYVTARGWEDLSSILRGYERNQIEVTSSLMMQYITVPAIARKFSAFYDLFLKYKTAYAIQDILDGKAVTAVTNKAAKAKFDERISVISLLRDLLSERLGECVLREEALQTAVKILRKIKKSSKDETIVSDLHAQVDGLRTDLEKREKAGSLDVHAKRIGQSAMAYLNTYAKLATDTESNKFKAVQTAFAKEVKSHESQVKKASSAIANAFNFVRTSWGESQEMILFVTELTVNRYTAQFISTWKSEDYFKYNQNLLVNDQEEMLKNEINALLKEK